ncbi:MAG: DNA-binding protein [Erysipelotrichaceae bacterium]|jgi:predicted DNA-binding protein YlxM (UPF0122 family)|nr:DNA-binding protein [Erysipelotrichaceae bacterium]
MRKKNEHYNALLDQYQVLLTKKQQAWMEDYYRQDLSISEIAENEGVSRAAVHDVIRRCNAHLDELEEKLKLAALHEARMKIYRQLQKQGGFQELADLLELEGR